MKARARAAATSLGTRAGVPALRSVARATGSVSSLRCSSARLKLLERRTTARFLHVSPRPPAGARHRLSIPEPKHSRSSTLPSGSLYLGLKEMDRRADRRIRPPEIGPRLPHGDRRKAFYSKYIHGAVDDRSKPRHSARFADRSSQSHKEDVEDVSRTFIRRRFPQSRSEDDGGTFSTSVGQSEKAPWHSAILRRSGSDGGIGRFVIRRSHQLLAPSSTIPESGHTSRSGRSVDIYGPRYSHPLAAQSASMPSSAVHPDYRPMKTDKRGSDERLLHAALSQSTVGLRWLAGNVYAVCSAVQYV